MLKIIILIIVLFIFITIYSFKKRIDSILDSIFPTKNKGVHRNSTDLEELIQCANCGTYVPKSQAVRKIRLRGDDLFFCSKECKDSYKKR